LSGFGAWLCALSAVLAIVIVPGDVARAVPTAALLAAHDPIPEVQFGSELRGAGVLSGATKQRLLHFTFDDGPDEEYTPPLLDALDRAGFKATFFFSTGRFNPVQRRHAYAPALAREIARRGHQVGSHGFDHVRMSRLRPPQLREQIAHSEAFFERVFGTRTFLYRPPFGSRNAAFDKMLADGQYATVMWNIGMADWVAREPDEVRDSFWKAIERNERETGDRGGIVLMHDTHNWSVAAFTLIAESIADRNCELLAAGEELYDVADSLAPWAKPRSAAALERRQAQLRARERGRCPSPGWMRPTPAGPRKQPGTTRK
jgi:peptidoglycan/xylan/chitin deacetylase (PgdA/CDA1 family)